MHAWSSSLQRRPYGCSPHGGTPTWQIHTVVREVRKYYFCHNLVRTIIFAQGSFKAASIYLLLHSFVSGCCSYMQTYFILLMKTGANSYFIRLMSDKRQRMDCHSPAIKTNTSRVLKFGKHRFRQKNSMLLSLSQFQCSLCERCVEQSIRRWLDKALRDLKLWQLLIRSTTWRVFPDPAFKSVQQRQNWLNAHSF